MQLTAQWSYRGENYQTELTGTLTPTGGTLSGKQSWDGRKGPGSRDCNVALVIAPKAGNRQ